MCTINFCAARVHENKWYAINISCIWVREIRKNYLRPKFDGSLKISFSAKFILEICLTSLKKNSPETCNVCLSLQSTNKKNIIVIFELISFVCNNLINWMKNFDCQRKGVETINVKLMQVWMSPLKHTKKKKILPNKFSDGNVTKKGLHCRCCYLEKHTYTGNSIFKKDRITDISLEISLLLKDSKCPKKNASASLCHNCKFL